jgi:hypothetical protein
MIGAGIIAPIVGLLSLPEPRSANGPPIAGTTKKH